MNPIDQPDILAVLRAPVGQYPPTVSQLALLARAGLTVDVVHTPHPEFPVPRVLDRDGVRLHTAGVHTFSTVDARPSLLARVREGRRFTAEVAKAIRQRRPKVVIAYDPNGITAAASGVRKSGSPQPRTIWHFHELLSEESVAHGGWQTRRTSHESVGLATTADLVVHPDADRARIFESLWGAAPHTAVVRNCPLRVDDAPAPTLDEHLRAAGVDPGLDHVLFQGWIGPSRCLEAVIDSLPRWPAGSRLVLVGPVRPGYRHDLGTRAAATGVSHLPVFLDTVPYDDLAGLTRGAALAIALVRGRDDEPTWKFSAGAINKRYEYMAAGVPQIASRGPGMSEIIEATGAGVLVDAEDPAQIGEAIAGLLEDPERRHAMAEAARKAHLERFHYEHEFAPVLDRILGWCRDDATRPAP